MEHIWLDRHGQRRPDEVPLYDHVRYDGKGFEGFLERLGLDIDQLQEMIDGSVLTDEFPDTVTLEEYVNSVVQEWLFFGAVVDFLAVLGFNASREQFIAERDGKRFLSTASLKSLLLVALSAAVGTDYEKDILLTESEHAKYERDIYAKRLEEGQLARRLWAPERKSDIRKRIYVIEKTTRDFLECNLPNTTGLEWPTWAARCILSETLKAILGSFLRISFKIPVHLYPVDLWPSVCRARNLCAPRMAKFYCDISFTSTYIACSILPAQTAVHGQCMPGKPCSAMENVHGGQSHRPDCCGSCSTIGLKDRDNIMLKQAVKDGHWGLVKFANDDPGSPEFDIVSSILHSTSFVALSHVWTHGLGNPEANAISTCQLLNLKRLLIKINRDCLVIWLDPLCVPFDPELKMAAVAQKHQIYATAEVTLVLDRNIENQGGSRAHKILQVLSSDWVTRIWTLQEALLPRSKLHFAFRDGISCIDDLLEDPKQVANFDMSSAMIWTRWRATLLRLFGRDIRERSMLTLVESFSQRSLRKEEDDPICFAILCDVPIQALPPQPQLHHVIEHFPTLPQDIVFADGRRSKADGFGWLPESFMNKAYQQEYIPAQTLVPRGPRGIRLEKDLAVFQEAFWFAPVDPNISKMRTYGIYAHTVDEKPYRTMVIKDCSVEIEEQRRARFLTSACLVYQTSPEEDVCPAILATDIQSSSDGILYAKFVALVWTAPFNHFERYFSDDYALPLGKLLAPLMKNKRLWLS